MAPSLHYPRSDDEGISPTGIAFIIIGLLSVVAILVFFYSFRHKLNPPIHRRPYRPDPEESTTDSNKSLTQGPTARLCRTTIQQRAQHAQTDSGICDVKTRTEPLDKEKTTIVANTRGSKSSEYSIRNRSRSRRTRALALLDGTSIPTPEQAAEHASALTPALLEPAPVLIREMEATTAVVVYRNREEL
ncbi:MAG: hypothetical protein GOMPHAMPRED_001404 [Gomphillus americanus]|uniref:Uncharacterized protein n=1 Tax=Gomphillus americanus TaxID=1940652 RepID=A0A8H3IGK8_9LECA|nr:MAG: hypothetical protein GOMPHAMPRED_001404 [Gomphillus americanus]